MLGELDAFARRVTARALRRSADDGDDAIAFDRDGVIFEHDAMRLDGDEPAGFDREVDCLLRFSRGHDALPVIPAKAGIQLF